MKIQPLLRRKFSVLIPILALGLCVLAPADEAAADDTYVANLSGVECNACKRTISRSLGRIKGVKLIRITKLQDGKHRMTVTTDGSAPVSRTLAEEALKKAEHYKILSWQKQGN